MPDYTEMEFVRTFAQAIAVDNFGRAPHDVARLKIALAREMFKVRGDYILDLTEEARAWVDGSAVMTPMGIRELAMEAQARYECARLCWSEIFALRLVKG